METLKVIKERRSIRKYTEEKVSHELIEEVIDMSRFAPSWKNTQITRYVVVEDPALKERIAKECTYNFEFNIKTIMAAPCLVVMTYIAKRSGYEKDGSFTTSKGDGWEMFDSGIATQTFCLAAHEKGLGTCIMGIFEEEKVVEVLGLPEGQKVGALVTLGFPGEEVAPRPRKEVAELVSYR